MCNEVTEEWKTIINYPNYSISNLGVVRNDTTKKIKKNHLDFRGYLSTSLCKDGKSKAFKHHRLLAQHFIPNLNNHPEIDHINGIRTDNRLENLRWVSTEQNGRNKKKGEITSSSYMGVSWWERDKKWKARITINKKTKHIGVFATELDAFSAWKAFVIENGLQEFYSQVEF
jgi:hypothetical protein